MRVRIVSASPWKIGVTVARKIYILFAGVRIPHLLPFYAQVMEFGIHTALRKRVLRVRVPPCAPFYLLISSQSIDVKTFAGFPPVAAEAETAKVNS